MASVLKAPSDRSRGVVVFTTQERDNVIRAKPELPERIRQLKSRWLVGLHHNWHDWTFEYDPLYDFSMAGEDDLRESTQTSFTLLPFDACNFVPPVFQPASGEQFWDVLYVGRAVAFKRLPEFLQTIRSLYDAGHQLRVLCVVPMPPYDPTDTDTVTYDLRSQYEELFSEAEQETFTLLDLSFRYPFPFDLETLAFFYRSSRVFVHFADNERRCRVAAYAWATGMPVVARAAVGSLLPPELRREPQYFEVRDDSEFPERILAAVAATQNGLDMSGATAYFAAPEVEERLLRALRDVLNDPSLSRDQLSCRSLDIRLGRHHGISSGGNRVHQSVDELLDILANDEDRVRRSLTTPDPELTLAPTLETGRVGAPTQIEARIPFRTRIRRAAGR